MNLKPLVLLFVFLYLTSGVLAQVGRQVNFDVGGSVKDQDGVAIVGVKLVFDRSGQKEYALTDINGEFKVTLFYGDYEVTIPELHNEKFKGFIRIREKELNPRFVNFTVDSTSLCKRSPEEYTYPKIVKSTVPKYPPAALAVRASGVFVVMVKVGSDGRVVDATVLSSHPLLRAAILQAARTFEFVPSASGVEHEFPLTFQFMPDEVEPKDVKRFTCPYWFVITAPGPTVDI